MSFGRVRKSRLVIHADLEERALPLGLYTCRWGLIMPFRKAGVEVYRLETSFYTGGKCGESKGACIPHRWPDANAHLPLKDVGGIWHVKYGCHEGHREVDFGLDRNRNFTDAAGNSVHMEADGKRITTSV